MTSYVLDLEDGDKITIKDGIVPSSPSSPFLIVKGNGEIAGRFFGEATIVLHPSRDQMIKLRNLIQDYLDNTEK